MGTDAGEIESSATTTADLWRCDAAASLCNPRDQWIG
jgi:hypothetical protein